MYCKHSDFKTYLISSCFTSSLIKKMRSGDSKPRVRTYQGMCPTPSCVELLLLLREIPVYIICKLSLQRRNIKAWMCMINNENNIYKNLPYLSFTPSLNIWCYFLLILFLITFMSSYHSISYEIPWSLYYKKFYLMTDHWII